MGVGVQKEPGLETGLVLQTVRAAVSFLPAKAVGQKLLWFLGHILQFWCTPSGSGAKSYFGLELIQTPRAC